METTILFFQIIGLALLTTCFIMGGIVCGVIIGKFIAKEVS